MIWGCELMILFIENVPRNDSDAPTAKRLSCKCTDQNEMKMRIKMMIKIVVMK